MMYVTVICLAVVLCGVAGVESEELEASMMKRMDNILTTYNKRFPNINQTLDDFEARTIQMETTLKHKRYQIVNPSSPTQTPIDGIILEDDEANIFFKAQSLANLQPRKTEALRFTEVSDNDMALHKGYDKSRGVFTAPIDGIYFFTVQLCSKKRQGICYAIHVKTTSNTHTDVVMGRVYGEKYDTCSSDQAIVKLRTNDEVTITSICGGLSKFAQDRIRHNIFSGVLLHQTYY